MRRILWSSLVLSFVASPALAQQQPDPDVDVSVSNPAHIDESPRIAIDAAHNNFHTLDNRFSPFAKLIANDGCEVVANTEPFAGDSLAKFDVLVIANAGGDAENEPMFTDAEIDALDEWVRGGGALFLIADHAPYGRLAMDVGARFGVEMRNCYTFDEQHASEPGRGSLIAYEEDRLADHPITRGRNESERINRAVTYTGQSLSVPEGATAILRLSDGAVDRIYELKDGRPVVVDTVSAAGRAQLVAIEHGDGRVVVSAEAAMFSAQIVPRGEGQEPFRMGFNRPESDDRQLTLNIVRWLTRAL